jgi:hypothetical protein
MKQIIHFPTWILAVIIRPFLSADHVWKNKKFTLTEWSYITVQN